MVRRTQTNCRPHLARVKRVLAGFILMAAICIPARAMAEDLVPAHPAGFSAPPTSRHEQPDIFHYVFDFSYAGTTPEAVGSVPLGLNTVMISKAWLLKVATRSVEYALSVNLLDPFLDKVSLSAEPLGKWLWDGDAYLVTAGIALAGLLCLLLYSTGQAVRAWGLLGGTTLILIASAAVLSLGVTPVKTAVTEARTLALSVYSTIERAGGSSGGGGLANDGADAAWDVLIYQPWALGEFGGASNDALVYLNESTDDRKSQANPAHNTVALRCVLNKSCPWWDYDHLPRRILLTGWTALATLTFAGSLLLLSGGILLAQLWLLFLVVLAPLWLLFALWWPDNGPVLVRRLALRAMGALVSQVVLAATLGVLLWVTKALSTALPEADWVLKSFLLGALALVASHFRFTWLSPFRAPQGNTEGEKIGLMRQTWSRLGRRAPKTDGAMDPATALAALREPIPVFSAVQAPPVQVEVAAGAVRFEHLEAPQRHSVQQETFQTQMRLLRMQLDTREEIMRREPRTERTSASHWEEPPPAPSSTQIGGMAGVTTPREQKRKSSAPVPPRRPRP